MLFRLNFHKKADEEKAARKGTVCLATLEQALEVVHLASIVPKAKYGVKWAGGIEVTD